MVSETLLAAVVGPMVTLVLGTVGWGLRQTLKSIERSNEERRAEHERVWETIRANYQMTRSIAEGLSEGDGPMADVDVDIPDHPYETRYEDADD